MVDSHTQAMLTFEKEISNLILLPHQLFHKTPLDFKIQFNCSFRTVIHEWISNREHQQDFVREEASIPVFKSFNVILEKDSNWRQVIKTELKDWNLPEENYEWLSKKLVYKTNRLIKDESSKSTSHSVINVKVDVILKTDRIVYESVEWMQRMGELRAPSELTFMIPAKDSCVKWLKKKLVDKDVEDCCSICLEDLSAGCRALSMPCSHLFHGTCIRKWLRTSHYCPICRFVMPTENN